MQAHQFVAHRGFQAEYPENTLIGVEAALDAGAQWIEIDIQISRDGVPLVVHDPDLRRISTSQAVIAEHDWDVLRDIDVGEPSRFGTRFEGTKLSRLRDVLALVERYPDAQAFVEVKKHCLEHRNAEQVAQCVLSDWPTPAQPVAHPVISFVPSILLACRAQAGLPVGLVLSAYDRRHRDWLAVHQPDWVFCNYQRARPPLWPGDSQWVMYPVNDVAIAKHWLAQGVSLIETDDIGLMLGSDAD